MYRYFGYFLLVYVIVLGTIIGWFIIHYRLERRYLNNNRYTKSK